MLNSSIESKNNNNNDDVVDEIVSLEGEDRKALSRIM
jgi:hypothetical protein